jgi:hypothetical protein
MNRLVIVAVLILLLAGLVGGALITRYRYYDTQGVLFHRIDRWTGRVEQWEDCPQKIPVPSDFDTVVSKRFDIPEGADLADFSTVGSEKPTWKAITKWIADAQKRESATGHYAHGISLWLAFLTTDKNEGKWDLVNGVCKPGWSSTP